MKANQPTQSLQNPRELDATLVHSATAAGEDRDLLLFVRHARRFRRIVRRILSRRLCSVLDPDDLLQEIAVVLLTKPLPAWISTGTDFTRYVGGITKNMALALNRKHLGGRHYSLDCEVPLDSVSEDETPPSLEPSSYDRLQQKEAVADLQESLPLRIRDVVAWICAGYSVAEVATSHDIDEETVVTFVCIANNFGPHPERRIDKDEALDLFKPHSRSRRKKLFA